MGHRFHVEKVVVIRISRSNILGDGASERNLIVSVPKHPKHIAPERIDPLENLGAPPRWADEFVEVAVHDHDTGQDVNIDNLRGGEIFVACKVSDAFVSIPQAQLPRLVEDFLTEGHLNCSVGVGRNLRGGWVVVMVVMGGTPLRIAEVDH